MNTQAAQRSREQAIELIYDSGDDPQQWQSLLAMMAEQLGFCYGNVTVTNQNNQIVDRIKFGCPSGYEKQYRDEFYTQDIWFDALKRSPEGYFFGSDHVLARPRLERTAYYNEFLKQYGIGHAIACHWQLGHGLTARFSLLGENSLRAKQDQDAVYLNSLARHFQRSLKRQYSERSLPSHRMMPDHFALLDPQFRILSMSPGFQSLIGPDQLFRLSDGHALVMLSELDHKSFINACVAFNAPSADQTYMPSFISEDKRFCVSITRMREAETASRSGVVVSVNAMSSKPPRALTGRSLSSLTPTEMSICRDLANGANIRQIAEARSRSELTVRKQVKNIQQKLGVNSQVALVARYLRALYEAS